MVNGNKDWDMGKDYTHMQIKMCIQDNGHKERKMDKAHMFLMTLLWEYLLIIANSLEVLGITMKLWMENGSILMELFIGDHFNIINQMELADLNLQIKTRLKDIIHRLLYQMQMLMTLH